MTIAIQSALIKHHTNDDALNDILKIIEPNLKKNKHTTSFDDRAKSKASKTSKTKVTQPKFTDSSFKLPRAKIGWSGPFQLYYLSKVSKDEDGKNIKTFKNFDDAVSRAESLGEKCAGITMTSTGYSLRLNSQLIENRNIKRSGYASWLIGDFTQKPCSHLTDENTLELEQLAIEGSVIEAEAVIESEAVIETEAVIEAEAEPIKEAEVKPKKFKLPKRTKEQKEQAKKVKAEAKAKAEAEAKAKAEAEARARAEAEAEELSESEAEVESLEVEEIYLNERKYGYEEDKNQIWDMESETIVGKRVDGNYILF